MRDNVSTLLIVSALRLSKGSARALQYGLVNHGKPAIQWSGRVGRDATYQGHGWNISKMNILGLRPLDLDFTRHLQHKKSTNSNKWDARDKAVQESELHISGAMLIRLACHHKIRHCVSPLQYLPGSGVSPNQNRVCMAKGSCTTPSAATPLCLRLLFGRSRQNR